jgi:hypothetical protein
MEEGVRRCLEVGNLGPVPHQRSSLAKSAQLNENSYCNLLSQYLGKIRYTLTHISLHKSPMRAREVVPKLMSVDGTLRQVMYLI